MQAAKVLVAIPARFGSQRLPGKPLRLIDGEPLICHTVRAVRAASCVHHVLVATDHADIASAAQHAGAEAVMTESSLSSGTDRIAAAIRSIRASMESVDAVVNVQGDEPFIDPAAVDLVAHVLLNCAQADISTLSAPLVAEDLLDTAKVKVVASAAAALASGASPHLDTGRALYFSRAPIGVERDALGRLLGQLQAGVQFAPNAGRQVHFGCRLHLGIYAFRPAALQRFVALPPSRLESLERLEQVDTCPLRPAQLTFSPAETCALADARS